MKGAHFSKKIAFFVEINAIAFVIKQRRQILNAVG
jgi:hypothetical protein